MLSRRGVVGQADEVERVAAVVADLGQHALVVGLNDGPDARAAENTRALWRPRR